MEVTVSMRLSAIFGTPWSTQFASFNLLFQSIVCFSSLCRMQKIHYYFVLKNGYLRKIKPWFFGLHSLQQAPHLSLFAASILFLRSVALKIFEMTFLINSDSTTLFRWWIRRLILLMSWWWSKNVNYSSIKNETTYFDYALYNAFQSFSHTVASLTTITNIFKSIILVLIFKWLLS